MTDENSNQAVGGGTPPAGPPPGGSFADDEKAMRGGRGGMVVGMILAGLAVVGALVFLVLPDSTEEFRKYGKNINGLRNTRFDSFWACAIEGAPLDNIKNNQELQGQLHIRGTQGKGRWGKHVQEQCFAKLTELQDELKLLQDFAPEDFRASHVQLHDAVKELRSGWSDYLAYVGALNDDPYDEPTARPKVNAIAKSWYDYRKTHSDINKGLKEKIDN